MSPYSTSIFVVISTIITAISTNNLDYILNTPQTQTTPTTTTATQNPLLEPINETPTPEISSQPVTSHLSPNSEITKFIYPSSTVTYQSTDTLTLESLDDTESILNWYQNFIDYSEYTVKNVIKTNTNGLVTNKLNFSGNGNQLSISIDKDPKAKNVTIHIIYNSNKSI